MRAITVLLRTGTAAALALAASARGNTRSTPDDSGAGWRLAELDLVVTVLPEEQRLGVEATARLVLEGFDSSRGPTLRVNWGTDVLRFLDLAAHGVADGAEVRWSATPGDPTRLAHLRTAEPFERGAELELSLLLESGGRANQLAVLDGIAFGSWVTAWYPVPVSSGDFSSVSLAAPGTTRFELPRGWHAVSNGQLVSEEESEHGTSVLWRLDEPVARSFAAGPYESAAFRAGGRDVRVYLLSSKPTSAAAQAETLARAIDAMQTRFGPYPYSAFAIAEIPEDSGSWDASSEQGFIMATSSVFEVRAGNLPLCAHEAAHAWWGNQVGTDGPGRLLCGEVLAEYGAVVAIEALEGDAAATQFLRFSREGYHGLHGARGYFALATRPGVDRPLAGLTGEGDDDLLADAKGAWVYHMLRRQIGDELFFGTLRSLLRDFTGRALTLAELRAAFLSAAPEAQLERFFADWLDRAGAPRLDVQWKPLESAGTHSVELVVRQSGEPYRLPLEVAVDSAAGERRTTVVLDGAECTVRVPAAGPATGVRIDPDHRLLLWEPAYDQPPPR